jgi:hypothetical protein
MLMGARTLKLLRKVLNVRPGNRFHACYAGSRAVERNPAVKPRQVYSAAIMCAVPRWPSLTNTNPS